MSINKINKKEIEKYMTELLEVLSVIKNDSGLTKEFIIDMLTPQEYADIATRWQIIKALAKGEAQRSIAMRLHVSTATVTRGSRELLNKTGGFYNVVKKLKIK